MKVKVKICGIRTLESAQAAIAGGADFIGFNFVSSSKRYIDPEICHTFIDEIKGRVKIVGVFQNAPVDYVNSIAELLGLDFVQLHGDESAVYIKEINHPVIKSINVNNLLVNESAYYLLLDRINQGQGRMVDVTRAKEFASKNKIFFAGGLTPDNVASVIEKVKPFAVDVASGIETNGKEDLQKINGFISNAKGVNL
jgi:phosphoribosylanthranilate isomerase